MGSIKDLRKIVNFCRKNGIISFRNAEFEFKISRQALNLPKKRDKLIEVPIAGLPEQSKAPSDLDMLLWSVNNMEGNQIA